SDAEQLFHLVSAPGRVTESAGAPRGHDPAVRAPGDLPGRASAKDTAARTNQPVNGPQKSAPFAGPPPIQPGGGGAGSKQGDAAPYDPSRVLVRFRPEATIPNGGAILPGTAIGPALAPLLVPGLRAVQLSPGVGVNAALAAYRANPLVLSAEPDYLG